MNVPKIIASYLSHKRNVEALKQRQKEEERKYTDILHQAKDIMEPEEAALIYKHFETVNEIEKEILSVTASFEESEDLLEDCLLALKGKSISYREAANNQTIHHLFRMANNEIHHTEKKDNPPQQ